MACAPAESGPDGCRFTGAATAETSFARDETSILPPSPNDNPHYRMRTSIDANTVRPLVALTTGV
jgi:hypothetical protein